MNADSAFVIGATHPVCQDYVVAIPSITTPYVILSDGCSSSPETDIGARLLVKSAELFFQNSETYDVVALHEKAAADALKFAAFIGLSPQAVDATLLTAHVIGNDLVLACSGDGVIMVRDWSGGLEAYSMSYPAGYPCYPTYTLQPDRLATLEFNNPQKEIRYFRGRPNQSTLELEDTFHSGQRTEVVRFKATAYEFAVLLSDGIHSFAVTHDSESSRNSRSIEFQSIARELVSFKNVRGSFAGRRLKRFLKDAELRGWQHSDDIALGAIYLGG